VKHTSLRNALRVPMVLSVVVFGCTPQSATQTQHDAGVVADAPRDGSACPVDAPPFDAKFGCVQPCGDISGSHGLCHGMEVCVDPCGGCPDGCEPLV
jgi:hypothetical protein